MCLENMGPTYDILFQSDENQNFTKSIFGYNKLKKLSFFVIAPKGRLWREPSGRVHGFA